LANICFTDATIAVGPIRAHRPITTLFTWQTYTTAVYISLIFILDTVIASSNYNEQGQILDITSSCVVTLTKICLTDTASTVRPIIAHQPITTLFTWQT
jgi:hypothetical protein